MKHNYLLSIIAVAVCFSSCSTEDMPNTELLSNATLAESTIVQQESDSFISFDNYDDYLSFVTKLSSLPSDEEKLQFVKTQFPDFVSIQNIYWNAMDEMAEIDLDSKEAYNSFETRFSCLFFPKYNEDAGFYIPMSNLDAAFLANKNCEVKIGSDVVNLKDIYSYDNLVNLGRAFYSDRTPLSRASYTQFNLKSTSMDPVGPDYDSGWTTYGNRKVKLKAHRRFETFTPSPGFNGSISWLHLEFCFRKKTWIGWTNYKSKSTISFNATIPGTKRTVQGYFEHNGNSSHDSEIEYPISITADANYRYYTFVETPCVATITYQGVDKTLKYTWNMPGIQCVTPISSSPIIFRLTL